MARNPKPIASAIPRVAASRLSLYLRHLELLQEQGGTTISSKELGSALGLTAAQVRKDLGYFGQFGLPGIGYGVRDLIPQIRRILGSDRLWKVALVGVGKLGSALLHYKGFEKQGFQIAALFDQYPRAEEFAHPAGRIHSMSELKEVIQREQIRLAIIAVPATEAQKVADQLVEAGIDGIFNFAPIALDLPRQIAYVSIDLAMQLEQLSYLVGPRHRDRGKPSPGSSPGGRSLGPRSYEGTESPKGRPGKL